MSSPELIIHWPQLGYWAKPDLTQTLIMVMLGNSSNYRYVMLSVHAIKCNECPPSLAPLWIYAIEMDRYESVVQLTRSCRHERSWNCIKDRQVGDRVSSSIWTTRLRHIPENEPSMSVCAAGGQCDRCGFERGANGGNSRGNSMEMQRWLCSKRL